MTNSSPLWHAWQTSPEIRTHAESWLTRNPTDWTDDDSRLSTLIHENPDLALSILFAIMQLTDDPKLLGSLGAGPMEDFLGIHSQTYIDTIHTLALRERRLREVLDNVWQGSMPKSVWHRIEILKQSRFS
jgi:Family of unknown function (DUF6869)